MLNETRSLTSERVLDQHAASAEGPHSLTCARCGGKVIMKFWQPQASCPNCGAIGYPDRAMRNLLPLGWDCPSCGEANDGRVNFCLNCGAGLASRCQRCEAPVYGSTCLQCGEHQARPRHLHKARSERVEWLPVQRERIERQVAHIGTLDVGEPSPEIVAPPPPMPARPQTRAERKAAERAARKAQKQAEKAQRKGGGWGFPWWIWIVGAVMLFRLGPAGLTIPQLTTPDAPQQTSQAWTDIQAWIAGISPSLSHISALTPADPEYAILFAIVLGGLVALPFGLFLVDRLIKRLFP